MKKFLLIWRQENGCDYTIGCGVRTEERTAQSIDAVREQVTSELIDQDPDSDMAISTVEVYELADPNISLNKSHWKAAAEERVARVKKEKQDAKDKAEYERLKKKFEV